MKKIILIVIMTLGFNIAYSQSIELSVISTSGEYFQGTNATLSWTLGEPVIETYSNGNAILTQGFQQSNYIINSINNLTADAFQINIYPNPSTDFINIDFSQKPTCLYIEMFDLLGKQILKKELVNLNEYIDLTNLAASEYFLKITTKEGKIIKTCKIIKVE